MTGRPASTRRTAILLALIVIGVVAVLLITGYVARMESGGSIQCTTLYQET